METSVGSCHHLSDSPNTVPIGLAKDHSNIKRVQRRIAHPDKIKLLGGFEHFQIVAEVAAVLKKSQEKGAKFEAGKHTIRADTVKVSEVLGDKTRAALAALRVPRIS